MKIVNALFTVALAGSLATLASAATPQAPASTPAPAAAPAKPATAKKPAPGKSFASPEDAAAALVQAVRDRNVEALVAVVGPDSRSWLFSGDKVADANDWAKFLAAYDEKNALEKQGDTKAVLAVGSDNWPFPAPLVKHGSRWSFDTNAGREEVVNRRVGQNELDAIQTLLAIVDAQREYAASDADGNGYSDYAQRFRSSPGKKDGLYWPEEGGSPSPLGPLVATATREGYGKAAKAGKPTPYHGYYFRILKSQGKDAHGGAYDYMVGDKMLGGFALVAYPASYGNSGVMTFVVNHDGVVFAKDLGAQTASMAASMTRFNPDTTWRKEP